MAEIYGHLISDLHMILFMKHSNLQQRNIHQVISLYPLVIEIVNQCSAPINGPNVPFRIKRGYSIIYLNGILLDAFFLSKEAVLYILSLVFRFSKVAILYIFWLLFRWTNIF